MQLPLGDEMIVLGPQLTDEDQAMNAALIDLHPLRSEGHHCVTNAASRDALLVRTREGQGHRYETSALLRGVRPVRTRERQGHRLEAGVNRELIHFSKILFSYNGWS